MITATPVLAVPYPDEALDYSALPVSADDGFPQAFLLDLGGTIYRLTFSVSYSDPSLILGTRYSGGFFALPDAQLGLFLNLTVELESLPQPDRLLGVSRITTDVPLRIGPLCFRFARLKVAQANLAGPGSFGSEVLGSVAVSHG